MWCCKKGGGGGDDEMNEWAGPYEVVNSMSGLRKGLKQPWYYSVLSYMEAEQKVLLPPTSDGTFLVWTSSQDDEAKHNYIVTYAFNQKHAHANLEQSEVGVWTMETGKGQAAFYPASLENKPLKDLIAYHKETSGQLMCTLGEHVPKTNELPGPGAPAPAPPPKERTNQPATKQNRRAYNHIQSHKQINKGKAGAVPRRSYNQLEASDNRGGGAAAAPALGPSPAAQQPLYNALSEKRKAPRVPGAAAANSAQPMYNALHSGGSEAGPASQVDDEGDYEEVEVDPLGYIKPDTIDQMVATARAPSQQQKAVLEAKRKAEYHMQKLKREMAGGGGGGGGTGAGAGAGADIYQPPLPGEGENNDYAWTPKGGTGTPAGEPHGSRRRQLPVAPTSTASPSTSQVAVGQRQRAAYTNETAIVKQERRYWAVTLLRCGNFAVCHREEPKEGDFSLCSACQIVPYCSSDCQSAHWQKHKVMCKELKAEAQANHSYENVELMKQIRSKYSATVSKSDSGSSGGGGVHSKYVNDLFSVDGFVVPFAEETAGAGASGGGASKNPKGRRKQKLGGAGIGGKPNVLLDQSSHTFGRRSSKLHEGSEL